MIKSLRAFIYLCVVCCFFISCSDVPQQYEGKLDTSNPNRVVDFIPKIPTDATNESGSRLLYQKRKLTEQEKKDKIRNNSLMPIDYKSASIGNISMKTEHDEALSILNKDMQMGQRVFYEENLMVIWREDSPRVPHMIAALNGYQGKMDFGSKVGHRAIGESFQDQFSKGIKDIQKDEKAISFITELYKYLEESEENCLETHKCQLAINPQGTYIMFVMPKMVLLFGNNERRQLVQIAISRNEKPGCFSQPFDMLNTQFFCGVSEDGVFITIKLGEGYKEVIQKSGIDPMLPINYGNSVLIQETFSTVISWKRINLEKEEESISENSHLSGCVYENSV